MQQLQKRHYIWISLVALGVLFLVLLGSGETEKIQYVKTVVSLAVGYIVYRLIAPRVKESKEEIRE